MSDDTPLTPDPTPSSWTDLALQERERFTRFVSSIRWNQ